MNNPDQTFEATNSLERNRWRPSRGWLFALLSLSALLLISVPSIGQDSSDKEPATQPRQSVTHDRSYQALRPNLVYEYWGDGGEGETMSYRLDFHQEWDSATTNKWAAVVKHNPSAYKSAFGDDDRFFQVCQDLACDDDNNTIETTGDDRNNYWDGPENTYPTLQANTDVRGFRLASPVSYEFSHGGKLVPGQQYAWIKRHPDATGLSDQKCEYYFHILDYTGGKSLLDSGVRDSAFPCSHFAIAADPDNNSSYDVTILQASLFEVGWWENRKPFIFSRKGFGDQLFVSFYAPRRLVPNSLGFPTSARASNSSGTSDEEVDLDELRGGCADNPVQQSACLDRINAQIDTDQSGDNFASITNIGYDGDPGDGKGRTPTHFLEYDETPAGHTSRGGTCNSSPGGNPRTNCTPLKNISNLYRFEISEDPEDWSNADSYPIGEVENIPGYTGTFDASKEALIDNAYYRDNRGRWIFQYPLGYWDVNSDDQARALGDTLNYDPDTELYIRIVWDEERFGQTYSIPSPHRVFYFTRDLTSITRSGNELQVALEDTYTANEETYQYRIGTSEDNDNLIDDPDSFQLQTSWSTDVESGWLNVCESDITTNGNQKTFSITSTRQASSGCGGDPTHPLSDSENYRVQVRARYDDDYNDNANIHKDDATVRNYVCSDLVSIATTAPSVFNCERVTAPDPIAQQPNPSSPDPAPAPGTPTIATPNPSHNRVTITWTNNDNGNVITETQYRYKLASAQNYPDWTTHSNPTATSVTLTSLSPSTSYDFQVQVTNSGGTNNTETAFRTIAQPQSQQPSNSPPATQPRTSPPATQPRQQPTGACPSPVTDPQGFRDCVASRTGNGGNNGDVNIVDNSINNSIIDNSVDNSVNTTNIYIFNDTANSVHAANIDELQGLGITQGCNPPINDRFCPERAVTRAEMATFLVRAYDLPETEEEPFTDVQGHIHEDNINRVAAAEISRGCNPPDNDQFCPDRAVSRAEMATFLARILGLEISEDEADFEDTEESVHASSINSFAEAGITKGCNSEGTMFCPERSVTRAEMATFLIRAQPETKEEEGTNGDESTTSSTTPATTSSTSSTSSTIPVVTPTSP